MLIIGELINSTRKEVKKALKNRNEAKIRKLARDQVEAGADVLDVNTATSRKKEMEHMEWAIGLIYDEVGEDIRLSIDSPNEDVVEKGFSLCKKRPLVNSINNKEESKDKLFPLIKKYDADFIGLTMGKEGMPQTIEDRLKEAQHLIESVEANDINLNRLYLDPLVMTVGSNQEQAGYIIETVRTLKQKWGDKGFNISVGLSNVSHGLPNRSIINQAFLAMLLEAGIDAALIDPVDRGMMDILKASETLNGSDRYCLNYIKYMRNRG